MLYPLDLDTEKKKRKNWADGKTRLCLALCEDQRKLQEEIGDCNTLCKLWAQGQSPVKFVPWASAGHARNSSAILGKVQLASLWLSTSRSHTGTNAIRATGWAVMLSTRHTSTSCFNRGPQTSVSFQQSLGSTAFSVTSHSGFAVSKHSQS